jgi:hypothetical protein
MSSFFLFASIIAILVSTFVFVVDGAPAPPKSAATESEVQQGVALLMVCRSFEV